MAAGGNISCECENVDKPVDYLGDSVCKVSVSSVREIIKKYEPDRELAGNVSYTSSAVSTNSHNRQLPGKSQSHIILEEEPRSTINAPVQHFFPKQTVTRSCDKTLEHKRSFTSNRNYDQEQRRSSLTDINMYSSSHQNRNSGDCIYQSRTTISKTPTGVRIITDLQFDKQPQHPENWLGSRVETEIPPSKILNEFQCKTMSK